MHAFDDQPAAYSPPETNGEAPASAHGYTPSRIVTRPVSPATPAGSSVPSPGKAVAKRLVRPAPVESSSGSAQGSGAGAASGNSVAAPVPPPAKGRANIRDVARAAEVSLTTVSLVLNKNDKRISDSTRQRVLDAMERLSYTPSRLARGLPNRRAKTLAVLVPALQHAFADVYFGEIISGAYEAAADRGYHIVLEVARREYIRQKQYMTLLDDCSVDGILFIGATEEHRWLREFHGLDKPMLVVNNHFTQWKLHGVVCDYPQAGRLAADYLHGLGHRRIGHICGPSNVVLTSRELTDAFVERLGELGVRLDARMIVDGQFLVDTGRLACDELLKRDPKLTAVFASNDKMAIGAYQSLRAQGMQPGRQVSIMGCDDIPTAALSDPPLTTIRMNFFEVGATACRRLLEIVERPEEASKFESMRVPVELVERQSCSALKPAKK